MHVTTHIVMAIVVIMAIRWFFASRCARATANVSPAPDYRRSDAQRDELGALRDRTARLEHSAVEGRSSAALAAQIDALRD